ncbi:MAG: iron ABC transporter permease, partial [Winogradskyella sp.]|nr:iron ABC transporter permease [Winogradskyella sp.]
LGVALVILGSGIFGGMFASLLISKWSVVIAASLGSFLVLLAVLVVSSRVRDTMAILIIGLMFGSIT